MSLQDEINGIQKQIDELQQLRSKLDIGEIGVRDFIDQGTPLAQAAERKIAVLSGQGSRSASLAVPLRSYIREAGIDFAPDDTPGTFEKPIYNLPNKFQIDLREALLPENITGEERKRIIENIPLDIDIQDDRFDIEREGIRQGLQLENLLNEERGRRAESLGSLSDLLTRQADAQFSLDTPRIREDANAAGLFRTTGLAEALADRRKQLAEQTGFKLGEAGLLDRAADIDAARGVLANTQGFQSSGLQRNFSLDDYQREALLAQSLARMATPSQPRSGGGKVSGALTGAGTGAAIGTSFAPGVGTAIGAGLGAAAGAAGSRGK